MRRPRAAVGLVAALLLGGCFDSTPAGRGSSVGPSSALFTAYRGPVRARLTVRPGFPTAAVPVQVELHGADDEGGALTLSVSYDGGRPDDEGTTKPDTCPAPPRSEDTRTERRTFEQPGDYKLRMLVISERCDGTRAVVEVRGELSVAPA